MNCRDCIEHAKRHERFLKRNEPKKDKAKRVYSKESKKMTRKQRRNAKINNGSKS